MKILADESLDGPVVEWLRLIGHDVVWIAEQTPGLADLSIIEDATIANRVIVTSDRDFGELVFRRNKAALGIVLVRIKARTSDWLLRVFQTHWTKIEARITGNFIVLNAGRIRIRSLK